MTSALFIPRFVLDALYDVEDQLPHDCFEPETVLTFMRLFGFDEASEWLREHRDLYFTALTQTAATHPDLLPR